MRQEKCICSFVFELSGFSPNAVVMAKWLPFWIKEDDCSHWKKVLQKWEVTLHCQKRWSKVSVSSLQKVQRSSSLIAILYKKECVGRRLWINLKWKIIISEPFCLGSSRFFCLFATRFLYVKLLGFFVFWKALVRDSTSTVSRLSIFSLNPFLIAFNVAIIPVKASGQLLKWYLFKNSV